jgi:PIN domain nuclease of toxin-antitoxin system
MILLDNHIWVWWVHGDKNLPSDCSELLQQHENEGLGISIISCWEVAKLVEYQRLTLPCPISDWFAQALASPNIELLSLTSQIAI